MFRNEAILTDASTGLPVIHQLDSDLVRGIVVDPKLTHSLSHKYFAVALLDTLLASIEGFLSEDSDFLSDIHLGSAITMLGESLSLYIRLPEDSRARLRGSEAGILSALGLASASQGPGGALSYIINSRHKIPKSWVSGVLLPHIVEYFEESEPTRLAKIAGYLGEDVVGRPATEVAPLVAINLRRLIGQLNIPTRLRDLNLSLGDLGEDCAFAMDLPYLKTAPFRLSESELYELAKSAF
jgi:alcohol dehydrogenase